MSRPQFLHFANSICCRSWIKRLYSLRNSWRPRDGYGLYTLGAAAYLDSPDLNTARFFGVESSYENYYNILKVDNRILIDSFSEIYSQLRTIISSYLGITTDNVCYSEDKALPGFVIYTPSQEYEKTSAHVPHYDLPYQNLSWKKESNSYHLCPASGETLSFTLPLQLPSSPSSLSIWKLKRCQAVAMERDELRAALKINNSKQYRYEVGKMLIHSGNELHQVRPWKYIENDSDRVTLQGHGVKVGNSWILYL